MAAFKIALTSFVITAGLIKGAPALAQPASAPEVQVSVVQTADLDLSSIAGKRELEQRLSRASREVCGTASDSDLEGKNDVRACRADVLAKARAQSIQLASRGAPIEIATGR